MVGWIRDFLPDTLSSGTTISNNNRPCQLSERSSRLANALQQEAGIRAGDVVAVMLPKGPDRCFGMSGCNLPAALYGF